MPTNGKGPGGGNSGVAGTRQLTAQMRSVHRSLLDERDAIDKKIAAVAQAMAALGGAVVSAGPAKRKPGRPLGSRKTGYRTGSLKARIDEVLRLSGAAVSVKDITKGVVKAGYKTKSKTLGNQVSAALSDMKVRKVGRGMYTV